MLQIFGQGFEITSAIIYRTREPPNPRTIRKKAATSAASSYSAFFMVRVSLDLLRLTRISSILSFAPLYHARFYVAIEAMAEGTICSVSFGCSSNCVSLLDHPITIGLQRNTFCGQHQASSTPYESVAILTFYIQIPKIVVVMPL